MIPQLDTTFYFSQIFWLCICFLILVFSFKKYFIPRMNTILSKRDDYINSCIFDVKKLESEVVLLDEEIRNLKEKELKNTAEIIKKAVKKSDNTLFEQLEIIKEENEGLINGTRKRINDEIRSIESAFKIQIDITSQIIFDKLFLQRL